MAKGKYKNKTVCIIDHGLYVEWAALLAKDFGKVYYYRPWEEPFPTSNALLVGKGIPGVTRVDSPFKVLDETDLFIFPDNYFGALQVHLESLGKRVWGARMGEELELFRDKAKKLFKSVGIPIGPYEVIIGMKALREYLRAHEDRYVKVSNTRGDCESFHSKRYQLVEPLLDDIEGRLGAKKTIMEFIVEEPINDAVEAGTDGFTIDGQFADNSLVAIEIKDRGLVMKKTSYKNLAKQLTSVNDKLADTFKDYRYRGFWSTEVRVTKQGKGYFIDPCARCGSPPNELYQLMISNWADIIWEGAGGTLVEPEITAKWGAELMIHSDWAQRNWQPIGFPEELMDHIKLFQRTRIDGRDYFVPQGDELTEIGAVVATGNTMDEAIKAVREIAEQLEGHKVEVFPECLDEAKSKIEKLKEFGVPF